MRFIICCLAGLILGLALLAFHSHAAGLAKEPAFQENFYGVQILDNRAWIVGYYGTILHSKDKGLSWEIQSSPAASALFRVRFVDGEKGWISGSYGTLLHTVDGGRKWLARPAGTTEHLFGLTWTDEKRGWAVGSRGTIIHTSDGGRSWIDSSLLEDLSLTSVSFINSTTGWIVGEFGVIFHSQNGGKRWVKQKSPVEVSFASGESRSLFALLVKQADRGWAFGLDGVILKLRAGSRWEIARQKGDMKSAPGANHLLSAAAFNGRIWTVGERGTLLHSELAGNDWQPVKEPAPPLSLNDIAFGKDGFGLIVGNRGVILRTENGGATWQRLKIATEGQRKGRSVLP
ncbi:MAG TPA: YCF48-related protein [Candidatus Binatia bacterium]|nr:YCF48-related protein [Candidatus Binatia bacterium]